MKFCIPTIIRFDTLDKLINQVLESSNLDIVIINNNPNGFSLNYNESRIQVYNVGSNLGVAKSWNMFFDVCDDDSLIISNDDISLQQDTIASMLNDFMFFKDKGIIYPQAQIDMPFSCFAISRAVYESVGKFDNEFFPGYYEDVDFLLRMWQNGLYRKRVKCKPIFHIVGGSTEYSYSPEMQPFLIKSREHLFKKWPIMAYNWQVGDDVCKNIDLQASAIENKYLPYNKIKVLEN